MPQATILLFREANGSVPLEDWLKVLEAEDSKAFAKCLERILQLSHFGNELRRPLADLLRDGIYELRARSGKVHYRILYFFSGSNLVCLSHGFTKEGKVPSKEIDKALERKQLVESNSKRYTAEWEV